MIFSEDRRRLGIIKLENFVFLFVSALAFRYLCVMQKTTRYIKDSLDGLYPPEEIRALTRILWEEVCGFSPVEVILHKDKILDESSRKKIEVIVEKLRQHEPIQYILGHTRFGGLRFGVAPGVLIPRPETEELTALVVDENKEKRPSKIIDIGTGPGFPGMPLKLYDPSLDITFVDSTQKRIDFIIKSAETLGVDAATYAARAEELIAKPGMRAGFDVVLSRAVAPLNILSELCLPFLRTGGQFLPLKSDNESFAAELAQARRAIDVLGGTVRGTHPYALPGVEGKKCVVIVQKTRETPAKYPRRYAKISQNPL